MYLCHGTDHSVQIDILPVSQKIITRRLSFAGHCHRATEQIVQPLLLWKPRGPVRYRGLTYPDSIARDAGVEREDLHVAMADGDVWRRVVGFAPAPRVAR